MKTTPNSGSSLQIGDYILMYHKDHDWLGQVTKLAPSSKALASYRAITQGYDQRVGDTYTVPPDWVIDSGPDLLTKYPELLI